MDSIFMTSDNNEYIIEISKEKKFLSYNKYSNYTCKITFYDFLQRVIFQVSCNENTFCRLCNILFDDSYLLSGEYQYQGIFQIDFDNNISLLLFTSEVQLFPTEDDPIIYFQFVEDHPIYGKVTRLFLKASLDFKDNLVYNISQILSDIPNINEINLYNIVDYYGGLT